MIVGVEGVSCTGKTTLISHLSAALDEPLVVPCYYHAAPDPAQLPPLVPETADEQLRALRHLLGIEALRRHSAADALAEGRTVILDRTADTLLAHTFALCELRGLDWFPAARAMVQADPATMIPDVTILLTVDPAVLAERARARPGMPPILYDPAFARSFNGYFQHQPLARSQVVLDADGSPEELAAVALDEITHLEPGIPVAARSFRERL